MRAVVTVVGSDKVGIVAGVTACLAKLEANIVDISMTLLSGNFTMMMMVVLPESLEFAKFKDALVDKGLDLGVVIHVQNEALFEAMHKL